MAALIKTLAKEIEQVGVSAVAERAGLSRQHLYKILSGQSHPTSENLESLSQAVSFQINLSRSKYYPADPAKERTLDSLVELIVKLYDPVEVRLFGSQARGDWSNQSDIDLMIIERKENGSKRGEIYVQATKMKIRDGFDAVFMSQDDFKKQRGDEKTIGGKSSKEGWVLYSRQSPKKKAVV